MSDAPEEKPKVVSMSGQPVVFEADTSADILDFIEKTRSIAAGEKHVAVGAFLVDAEGRIWANFAVDAGAGMVEPIAAATILSRRVVDEYEKQVERIMSR